MSKIGMIVWTRYKWGMGEAWTTYKQGMYGDIAVIFDKVYENCVIYIISAGKKYKLLFIL